MGGGPSAKAKSTARSITDQLIDVISQQAADASGRTYALNDLQIKGCKWKDVHVEQEQFIEANAQILQDISSSAETEQKMEQEVQQITEAQSTDFDFLSGGSEAETLLELITKVSTSILQQISSNCSQTGSQTNAINCEESELDNVFISQKNLGTYIFECTQKQSSVTRATQELETFISQHTSATIESTLVMIAIIFGVVIGVIVIVYIIAVYVYPAIRKSQDKKRIEQLERPSASTEVEMMPRGKMPSEGVPDPVAKPFSMGGRGRGEECPRCGGF